MVGIGLGVGIVRSPPTHHEGVVARAAGSGQEVGGRIAFQHKVDVILAQQFFQLLGDHHRQADLGGIGLIGHIRHNGEGDARGGQLFHGLGLVFQRLLALELVFRAEGQQHVKLRIVLAVGGAS